MRLTIVWPGPTVDESWPEDPTGHPRRGRQGVPRFWPGSPAPVAEDRVPFPPGGSVMSETCQDLECLAGIRVVDFTQFEACPW